MIGNSDWSAGSSSLSNSTDAMVRSIVDTETSDVGSIEADLIDGGTNGAPVLWYLARVIVPEDVEVDAVDGVDDDDIDGDDF
jgi:hypothetical protein